MKFPLFIAAALLLAACGGEAPEENGATATPTTETPTTETATTAGLPDLSGPHVWTMDRERSSISFEATQQGEPFTGRFGTFRAAIRFDPADLSDAMIVAVIDLSSVDAGDEERNEALPTGDWFAVREHPNARFVSETVTRADGDRYEAAGTLTIKGVERDATLPFTLAIEGDRATAQGEMTIDRTDFNVGTGAYEGGKWVGKDVTVAIAVTAQR